MSRLVVYNLFIFKKYVYIAFLKLF